MLLAPLSSDVVLGCRILSTHLSSEIVVNVLVHTVDATGLVRRRLKRKLEISPSLDVLFGLQDCIAR